MFFALLAGAIFAIIAVLAVNRLTPIDFGRILSTPGTGLADAVSNISVATWNIGYAGLGAESDFIVDGGSHIRALKKPQIARASDNIGRTLADMPADVLLIQEAASPSFLTRGVDVRRAIVSGLGGYSSHFWADFRTYLIPSPLRLEHGMANLARLSDAAPKTLPLPQDPKFYAGFLKKYYAGLVSTYPIAGTDRRWTVINIHLSAFDQDAATRNRQIAALFDFAGAAYARGDHVIIGGDWNMRLARTEFPHRTEDKYLFWVHDMPEGLLPQGWHWAIDDRTPTVRTVHQPYVAGETYTMIIDGFAVSPNVRINEVVTQDTRFEHTDHHPVLGRFTALDQT